MELDFWSCLLIRSEPFGSRRSVLTARKRSKWMKNWTAVVDDDIWTYYIVEQVGELNKILKVNEGEVGPLHIAKTFWLPQANDVLC